MKAPFLDRPRACGTERRGGAFLRRKDAAASGTLTPARHVARILRQALEHGRAVEIDGLGTFLPGRRGFHFIAQNSPRIFIA